MSDFTTDEIRIVTFAGFEAVAPVDWVAQSDKSYRKPRNALRVYWGSRFGYVGDELARGRFALAPLIATTLPPRDQAVLVLYGDASQRLWFSFIVAKGEISLGTEALFGSREELLEYGEEIRSEGVVALYALSQDLMEASPSFVADALILDEAAVDESGVGRFADARLFSLPALSSRALVMGGSAAAVFAVVGAAAWLFLASGEPSAKVVEREERSRDFDLFVEGCPEALAGRWPRAPQWVEREAGCHDAIAAPVPAITALGVESAAYRIFGVANGFEPAWARIHGREMLDRWDEGEATITDTEIIAVIPFDHGWTRDVAPPASRDEFFERVAGAFLSIKESITETGAPGEFLVTSVAPPATLLEIAKSIPNAEARRVMIRGDRVELIIGQKRTRSVRIDAPLVPVAQREGSR